MNAIYEWIIGPFQYGFMQSALFASVIIAMTCGVIGS